MERLKKILIHFTERNKRLRIMCLEYMSNRKFDSKKELELDILLLVHSLEKGMSFNNPKVGFGQEKARRLKNKLILWYENKYDVEEYTFKEGLSCIAAYLKSNVNIELALKQEILELFDKVHAVGGEMVGHYKVDSLPEGNWTWLEYERFIYSRHSFRDMKRMASLDDVKDCVRLAIQSPSACNRQPWKVYITENKNMINKIKELVPGNKGFEESVPNYLAVTCDRAFFGSSELFQNYVNGGIFLSNLVYALWAKGIGSCIFQWPVCYKKEKAMKSLFNISSSESIIAIVGYGIPGGVITV